MKPIIIILCLFFSIYVNGQDNWTQKAPFNGTARYHAASCTVGSKAYVGTGWENYSVMKNDWWEFDPAINTWTRKADLPAPARYGAVAFAIGNKAYVATGTNESTDFKDFWEYDPANNSWTQKADFPGSARKYAVGFSASGKGYLGTGLDIDNLRKDDFWEYDPVVDLWAQRASFPGDARFQAVGTGLGTIGYLGTGLSASGFMDDWYEFNTLTNTWLQKTGINNGGRFGGSIFALAGKVYIACSFDIATFTPNSVWEYDPWGDLWVQKNNFSGPPRTNSVAFSVSQRAFLSTGFLQNDWVTNDFWEYTPASTTISNPAGALHFDGKNDYVEIPHTNLLNSLPLTVECWVKTANASGITGFVNKYISGSGNGWRLGANNGYAEVYYYGPNGIGGYNGSVIYDNAVPGLFIADNQWHHVAMVIDNSGTKLYIDGTVRATSCWAGAPTAPNTTTPLRIGSYPPPGGFQNGSIDEVRIWGRALCEQELANNKDCELVPTQTGLIAYYKFNQGNVGDNNSSISTLVDAGPNSMHGTLYNFALNGNTSNWASGHNTGNCTPYVTSCPNAPVYCPPSASVIFNPDLWLKADAGVNLSGSNITLWQDQSGNNRNATPSGNIQLVPNAQNGKPVVRFVGGNNGFTTPAFPTFPGKRGTVIVVSKTNGPGYGSGIGFGTLVATYIGASPSWAFGTTTSNFGYYDGFNATNMSLSSSSPSAWSISTLLREENTRLKFFRNGNLSTNNIIADNQPSINPVKIGWNGSSEVLNGDIAEVIIYGRALSATELASVNQYLADKYNIATITLTPQFTVSSNHINYGNLGLGFSLMDSVIITNTGNAPLQLSGIISSNPVYSVVYSKDNLAPGDSTHLILRYEPTVQGATNATISISHNATGSPTIINVQGNAVATGYTYQVNQIPGFTGNLYGASWFNGNLGFVAGAGGIIYRTTDGGATWTLVPVGTGEDIYSIRSIGSALWIFGSNGLICVSYDGGSTWTPFNTGISNTFYGGYFVNSYYGFAVGGNGTLCRYNGTAWEPYNLGLPNTFYNVFAYGNSAWAVGSGGIVCRYNRACNCWQAINPGVTNNIYGVGFWNESIGYIVGSGGLIYRTVNGGTTWVPCTSGVNVDIRKIRCYNANIAWAVCGDGRILQTKDGGLTWVQLPLGNFNFEDVDFNGCQGLAICQDGAIVTFQIDVCSATYNTLRYVRRGIGSPYGCTSAWYSNKVNGGIAGRYGSVFITNNGGQTWASTNPYTTEHINCIRIAGNTSFIAGSGGYLAKCNNLGTNWVRFTGIPGDVDFYSMAFYPNGTGWAVGSRGTICYYNGTGWVPYNTGGIQNTFRCVYVIGNVAYAVGTNGIICKYNGTTWIDVSPGVSNDFYGCAFVTPLIGYAVGAGGIICKTIDGGQNWFPITSPANEDLYCVEVGCKLEAMVAGKNGHAYQTSDGGNSWLDYSLDRPVDINSISIFEGEGLLAAEDGEVYTFQFGAPKVTATMVANGPVTFCEGGSVVLTASGGSEFVWSNNATTPSITVTEAETYTVIVSNEAGCSDEKEQLIIVNKNPSIDFQLQPSICVNAPSIGLTATPASGSFSGPGISNNRFEPQSAREGEKDVTYSVTSIEGCTASITNAIRVDPVSIITFNPPSQVCINTGTVPLWATPTGGTFSGQGLTGNTFDPAIAGMGDVTINYSYRNNFGCASEREAIITVNNISPVSFDLPLEICSNGSPIILYASPVGGIFTGPGMNGNTFDPASSGTGAANITYNYSNSKGCVTSLAKSIVVKAAPVASAGNGTKVYYGYTPLACANLLGSATGGTPGYSYKWNTGATTAEIKVCPTVSSTYNLTVTDSKGCLSTSSVLVNVVDVRCLNNGQKDHKVWVCHTEPKKQNVMICVDEHAVPMHLAHGDQLGECNTPYARNVDNRGDENATGKVNVYPNPSYGIFHVNYPAGTGRLAITVFDMNGKKVAQHISNEKNYGRHYFALPNLAKGIYSVQVIQNGNVNTSKVVVQ